MKRLLLVMVLGVCLLFSFPSPASAWNSTGHMVSGAIAYSELKKNDPQAEATVIAILKENPEFDRMWQSQLAKVDESDREQLLFMLAARWSDDIRRNNRYHRSKWHYINLPYSPDSIPFLDPDSENILAAFQENLNILQSNASGSEKAIALCWVFHLVGDVHQPLHTTSLFTKKFPDGDRGGTRFYIRVREDRATISLHRFWDDLIGSSRRFQFVRNRATELRLNKDYDRDALPELSETKFDNWAKPESFELAKTIAYRNGTLNGSTDERNGVVLPSDYLSLAQTVAQKRIVLAGYRLADLLAQIY
jgi:S1/P1 Nuclease